MPSVDIIGNIADAFQITISENVKSISGENIKVSLGYPNTKVNETGSLPAAVITQITPTFIEPLGFGYYVVTTGSQWYDILSGSARNILGVRITFSLQVDIWARNPREKNWLASQAFTSLIYPSTSPNRDYYKWTGSKSPQIRAGILISKLTGMADADNRATHVSSELPLYQTGEPLQVYRKVLNYELITEHKWNVIYPLIGQILVSGSAINTGNQLGLATTNALWSALTGSEQILY